MTSHNYSCDTCKNRDDCNEVDSEAVQDISRRCGLACHSAFCAVHIPPTIQKKDQARPEHKVGETLFGRTICYVTKNGSIGTCDYSEIRCNACTRNIPVDAMSSIRDHPSPIPESEPDIKEMFRKEIAKWKDEDPLFMAYVHGQEAGRKEATAAERKRVRDLMEQLEGYIKDSRSLEDYQSAWNAMKQRIPRAHP